MEQACTRGYREPPSQKPAQQGNQTGESGCQQWLILQKKTQQFSFPHSPTTLTSFPVFWSNESALFSLRTQNSSVRPQDVWFVPLVMTCFMCITCRSLSFGTICHHFENIHSQSHPLIYLCGEGRRCCDAKTASQFTLWDASYGIDNTCWQHRWEQHYVLYSHVSIVSFLCLAKKRTLNRHNNKTMDCWSEYCRSSCYSSVF